MITSFVHESPRQRIVFAAGAIDRVSDEVDRLRLRRVLVVGGDATLGLAERVRNDLGNRSVGLFSDVVQHVPAKQARQVVQASQETHADGVVTVGGGSTTGLGKMVALSRGLPLLAVPTTYAGSEMTPIYGVTADGRKQTGSDSKVLPRTVIYDPALTVSMPAALTASSGMNSLAHCVEALWLQRTTPYSHAYARLGIEALATGLTGAVKAPEDLDARSEALLGASLAGAALGLSGTGLHHKICHVLGGSYGLGHSEVHSAVLPQVIAFNAPAIPRTMIELARALGVDDAGGGCFDLAQTLGAPTRLDKLGLKESDLAGAVDQVMASPLDNPRSPSSPDLMSILRAALLGIRPAATVATLPA